MTTPEPPEEESKVILAVRVNGKLTRIEDLPLEVIDRIAKEHNVPWLRVIMHPMSDLALARAIVDAVGEHVGYTVEPNMSLRKITALFTAVPDDVPDPDYIIESKEDGDPDPFRGGVGT